MVFSKTKFILAYCRLSANMRQEHADWCELVTGLWHSCDCGFTDDYLELAHLMQCIKRAIGY